MAWVSRRIEAGVAVVLTFAAIWLHWLAASSAGALWRDEANTVALATLPRISDVWHNIQFDSFPVVWLGFVRVFAELFGPMNDFAFRALGFLIGLSLLAALWLNARVFGHRYPVIALLLIGLSPTVVRWGDSMRAYGIGMVLILVTAALIWRFVDKSSHQRFVAATVFAIASVNTLYYNSVLLLALCAGAVAVSAYQKRPKIAAKIVALGIIAALTLLPYTAPISRASGWNSLVRVQDYTLDWFWTKLFEALMPAGAWTFVVWLMVFLAAILTGLVIVIAPRFATVSNQQREHALFALVTLSVGSAGSVLFLKELAYYTQPWYYLTLILISGFSIDILFGAFVDRRFRIAVSLAALVMGIGVMMRAPAGVAIRMTNVELVSGLLDAMARPGDLIIVHPWYQGVSFDRYYRGQAPWITAPNVSFHKFHRYDLIMALSRSHDRSVAVKPVLAAAEATLRRGGTVYVTGSFPQPREEDYGNILPSNPVAADQDYQSHWADDLARFLRNHATTLDPLTTASDRPISRYEKMTVTAVHGWQ